jgi:hypothetical protein
MLFSILFMLLLGALGALYILWEDFERLVILPKVRVDVRSWGRESVLVGCVLSDELVCC